MVGLLEVVARLEVLSEEERRRASREEWKRVEEAGWEVVRRAEGVEVKKEKKEEEEEEEEEEEKEDWLGGGGEDEEEEEEEEEEVRVGWWKCRGSCGRELELNADNFNSRSKQQDWIRVQVQSMQEGEGGCSERVQSVQRRLWQGAGRERRQLSSSAKRPRRAFRSDCKSCFTMRVMERRIRMFPMAISDARASVDRF